MLSFLRLSLCPVGLTLLVSGCYVETSGASPQQDLPQTASPSTAAPDGPADGAGGAQPDPTGSGEGADEPTAAAPADASADPDTGRDGGSEPPDASPPSPPEVPPTPDAGTSEDPSNPFEPPAIQPGEVGSACQRDGDCDAVVTGGFGGILDGICRGESDGYPGGSCSAECSGPTRECGPRALCIRGLCERICSEDADCRLDEAYECRGFLARVCQPD